MEPRAKDVLEAYARAQLGRAIDCLGWSGRRRHSGVHQARKSLRRVRATLALAGDALGPDLAVIDVAIRAVNVSLSALRDAQALVEVIERLARHADGADSPALLESARRVAIARRMQVLRGELRADPGLSDRRDRLATLARRIDALDWSRLATTRIARERARAVRRAAKAGQRAIKGDSDERWHRWRRRVRRLGQQGRALGSTMLSPDPRAKKLAGLLGRAQDLTLLARRCGHDSPFSHGDRRALARLARREGRRARKQIQAYARRHGEAMLAVEPRNRVQPRAAHGPHRSSTVSL